MADYPYDGQLIADPVTFQRATNAQITVYDAADTSNTTKLVLKDTTGLPLPNPLTSTADAFTVPFYAPSQDIKLVGAGLTVFVSSAKGMRDAAAAAAGAAQTAASEAITAAGNAISTASVNGSGELVLQKASGATVTAGSVKGPKGDRGDKGLDGANVLPTAEAIAQAVTTDGPAKTALSATYDPAERPAWASTAHKFDPRRSVYNLSPRSLPRWSSALARAADGGANAHLVVLGDSISRGAGANIPYTQWAWPSILRNNMVKFLGDPGGLGWNTFNDEANTAADPLTVVTGFVRDGSRGLHQEARTSVANGNTIVYGPINSTKFRIKWAARVAGGQFTWAVNGGSTTTIDTAAAVESIQETVITVASAANTLTITALGANVTILAFEAIISDTGKVKVTRGARNGAKIGNINSTATPTSALALFPTLAPDLTVIALETNDFDGQTPVDAYKASVKAVIDTARAVNSDVLLVATIPPDLVETIPLTAYTGALYELADEYNLPLLDMQHRWGSFAVSNAAPYAMYADALHPSRKGHQDYARAVYDVVAGAWLTAPVVGTEAAQTWSGQQQFNGATKFGTGSAFLQVGLFNNIDTTKQSVSCNGNDLLLQAATGGSLWLRSNLKMDGVFVQPANAGTAGWKIRGFAGQTAALLRVEDSGGVEKYSLDPMGRPYTKSNAPTVAAAGGSTSTSVAGNDPSMTVNFTTANGTAAGTTVATVTFSAAYGSTPRITLAPLNAASVGAVFVTGKSTTGFSLALSASQAAANAMSFDVHVIGG